MIFNITVDRCWIEMAKERGRCMRILAIAMINHVIAQKPLKHSVFGFIPLHEDLNELGLGYGDGYVDYKIRWKGGGIIESERVRLIPELEISREERWESEDHYKAPETWVAEFDFYKFSHKLLVEATDKWRTTIQRWLGRFLGIISILLLFMNSWAWWDFCYNLGFCQAEVGLKCYIGVLGVLTGWYLFVLDFNSRSSLILKNEWHSFQENSGDFLNRPNDIDGTYTVPIDFKEALARIRKKAILFV